MKLENDELQTNENNCKEFRRNRLQIIKYTKQFKTRKKKFFFLINNLLLILKINLLFLLTS